MRGKALHAVENAINLRITPAYAGKSIPRNSAVFDIEDHPRLCGEKYLMANEFMRRSGSPPPMRGKAFWGIHVVPCQGITPAYAGKSWIPITQFLNIQDHPRLCGEKF